MVKFAKFFWPIRKGSNDIVSNGQHYLSTTIAKAVDWQNLARWQDIN